MGEQTVVHEWRNDRDISERVLEAVAEETGRDVRGIEPIYGVLDPGCLDALFRPTNGASTRTDGHVRFPLADCDVTVYATGRITVRQGGA